MDVKKRAYDVVNGFKASLETHQLDALTDENFEELQMLIEASIGANAANILHDMAKQLEEVAHRTRQRAADIADENVE